MRRFKMEVFFEVDGDITTDQFKQDMIRRLDDFTLYSDDSDEDNDIQVFDYWETAIVSEIL